jgi:hypothetical protein
MKINVAIVRCQRVQHSGLEIKPINHQQTKGKTNMGSTIRYSLKTQGKEIHARPGWN